MDQKSVIVTGIGGNVGQGIIRNIRATGLPVRVVGTNVTGFSAGNHLCDTFCEVPYAYDEAYIAQIQALIKSESTDLIIPATDYEALYLAEHEAELGCALAASNHSTASIYIDKFETFLHHDRNGIAFARAALPSRYDGSYDEHIVKPRKGRGSRNLHVNHPEPQSFDDQEYMVQELQRGKEITCAFYVTRSGELHGLITFERELENGATSRCVVTDLYDQDLRQIIGGMMQRCEFRGAINIQAIVDDAGTISPFEVNCRISGTNSIRSNFGFKDVLYTLQEHLYGQAPDPVEVTGGAAVRVLMDVIYPGQSDFSSLKDRSSEHFLY